MATEDVPRRVAGDALGDRLMSELDQTGETGSPQIMKRRARKAEPSACPGKGARKAFRMQVPKARCPVVCWKDVLPLPTGSRFQTLQELSRVAWQRKLPEPCPGFGLSDGGRGNLSLEVDGLPLKGADLQRSKAQHQDEEHCYARRRACANRTWLLHEGRDEAPDLVQF